MYLTMFLHLRVLVPELGERHRHSLVDNLHQAAADELLVFDQRDVRLHPGRVAVHHEADCAGRRQHGCLGVPIAVLLAEVDRLVPGIPGGVVQGRRDVRGIDARHGVAVLAHHAQERLAVAVVPGERPAVVPRDARRLRVGLTGHERGDRGRVVTPLVAVVGQPLRHEQRPQVRVAEPQRTVIVTVAADRFRRIARIVDKDLLGRNQGPDGGPKRAGINIPVLGVQEPHQVD